MRLEYIFYGYVVSTLMYKIYKNKALHSNKIYQAAYAVSKQVKTMLRALYINKQATTSDIRIFNAFKSPLNKNKSREDSKISGGSPEQKGRKGLSRKRQRNRHQTKPKRSSGILRFMQQRNWN